MGMKPYHAEVCSEMTEKKKTVTPLQSKAVDFISRFSEQNGYSPSFQEIADYLGTTPPSVDVLLQRLVRHGCISKQPGIPRSIRVLKVA